MNQMEILVEEFHDLFGSTIPEYKENFNHYLNRLDKDTVFTMLPFFSPKNMQEQLFRIKIMQHFELHADLMELLFEENVIATKKITRDKLFIEYIAKEIGAKDFIDEICPNISFSTRSKLVYKLGFVLDATADEYFEAVKSNYGLMSAKNLLPACTLETILRAVLHNNVRLNSRQLFHIHLKHPEFLYVYFKKTNLKFGECTSLAKNLLKTDIKTFCQLTEFGKPNMGPKSIVKVLKEDKEVIMKNSIDHRHHSNLIRKHLSESEYARYYRNMFPETPENFPIEVMNLVFALTEFPIEERYKVFTENFRDAYNMEFTDSQYDLLELLRPEDRLKFNLDDYPEMRPIHESIELFKTQLNLTEDEQLKSELVCNLVKTCHLNYNLEALLDVLKYFCKCHLDDNVVVRKEFLLALYVDYNLSTLSDKHFRLIEEILSAFDTNREMFYHREKFTQVIVKKKIDAGVDISSDIISYINRTSCHGQWRMFEDEPKYSRICILKYPQVRNRIVCMGPKRRIVMFLQAVVELNKTTRKYRIDLHNYPDYLKYFFEEMTDYESMNHGILKSLFMFKPITEEAIEVEERILDLYMENAKGMHEVVTLNILKRKPHLIDRYADRVIHLVDSHYFYYELSKMHYNAALATFKSKLHPEHSLMSFSRVYLDAADSLERNENCIAVDQRALVMELHKTFLINIKNVEKQQHVVTTITKYSCNKYFPHALSAFYRCFSHIPEKNLLHNLQFFLNNSDHLKKHAMYVAAQTMNLRDNEMLAAKLFEDENNSMMKKCLYRCAISAFCNNPCNSTWSLLIKKISSINSEDEESLELLPKIEKISEIYLPVYLEQIWSFLKPESYPLILLHLNADIVAKMSFNLCCTVIKSIGFKTLYCKLFVYNFLAQCQELPKEKVNFLLELVNVKGVNSISDINNLFETFCNIALANNDPKILNVILENLRLPFVQFNLDVLMGLTKHYLENGLKDLAAFALKQQKTAIDKYGSEVLSVHAESVKRFFELLFPSDESEDIYQFLEYCLETELSLHGKLLILKLLPKKRSEEKQTKILKALESKEDDEVFKIYMTAYYVNLK